VKSQERANEFQSSRQVLRCAQDDRILVLQTESI
jgi:hypothetical protein